MNLQLLHRRLTVSMGLVSLMAFAGGAGFEPVSALLAAVALTVAWVWQPDSELSLRLERFWLPVAGILVARSLYHVVLVGDDVVIPVVDLLLLLLCAESLRSLEAPNDARLYALTFALLVASSAYPARHSLRARLRILRGPRDRRAGRWAPPAAGEAERHT